MHKFHNDIKREYLKKYSKSNSNLLDLASGRGGDLQKWNSNKNIISVTGYDINEDSVSEAKIRRKNLKSKKDIQFIVKDLSKFKLFCKNKYKIVTSFFAFHYFFKNRRTIDTIFSSISNCTEPGSVVILALFDGDLVKTLPEFFETGLFSINRTNEKSISVTLKNSILSKPEIEYLVSKQQLVDNFEKIGFSIVEYTPFYTIENSKYKLTSEEQMYSDLNVIVVFKRVN
jgi:ubiquinone/menaquinone biosynthesis C-methylase UbiE